MTDEPVPPEGWHVRVTLSDGTVLRPEVVDDPRWEPSINDKPEALVPVRPNDLWVRDDRVDRADAAAWLDGQRLPIDTLTEINASGSGPPELVLTGGRGLDNRVQRDVDNVETHVVADNLISSESSLVADVDEPDPDPLEQLIQDRLDVFDGDIDATTPAERSNGSISLLQSSFMSTTDELDRQAPLIDDSDPVYQESEGDDAIHLVAGRRSSVTDLPNTVSPDNDQTITDNVSVRTDSTTTGTIVLFDSAGDKLDEASADTSFEGATVDDPIASVRLKGTETVPTSDTIYVNSDPDGAGSTTESVSVTCDAGNAVRVSAASDYTVPSEHVALAVRWFADDSPGGGFAVDVVDSGSFGPSLSQTLSSELVSTSSYQWETIDISGVGDWAGDDDLIIELIDDGDTGATIGTDPGVVIDAAVVYDNRFSFSFDNSPSGSPPRFATPAPYAPLSIDAEKIIARRGADDATITITTNSTANAQALAMSTDGGQTFDSAGNTAQHTFGFDSPAESLTAQLTLDGYGSQSESPTQKPNAMSVDDYQLDVTVSNIPRTINAGFDATLGDILRDLADDSGAIWAVDWLDGQDAIGIVWTQPGQRVAGDALSTTAWRITRDNSGLLEAATVVGSRARRSGESQTVGAIGDRVSLDRSRIIDGTEQVRATDGTEYDAAADYHLYPQAGEIKPLAIGDISAGETLEIEYEWKVDGRFESDDWSGDAGLDDSVPISQLPTETACEQAAELLVSRASTARLEATVDLSALEPTQSVTESLDFEAAELSDLGPWRVREINRNVATPTITLGRGTTVEEEAEQLRQGLTTLNRRT